MTPEQAAEFEKLLAQQQQGAATPTPAPTAAPVPAPAENMTIEQGTEFANRQAAEAVYDEMPWYEKFQAGMGKGLLEAYYGGKELLGLDDEEDQFALQALEAIDDGWGTAGNITGEVLTLAVPGGAIAKGATKLPKVGKALKTATSIAGEAAMLAGWEGLKAPAAGETRGENATEAALWSLGLGVLGPATRKIMRSRLSKEGKELLDEGVRLTPGMAAKTNLPADIENIMSKIPILKGGAKKLQRQALEDWNEYLLKKVAPQTVNKGGRTGFKQAQKELSDQYENIWKTVKPDDFDLSKLSKYRTQLESITKNLPADDVTKFKGVTKNVFDDLRRFRTNGNTQALAKADDRIREAITQAVKQGKDKDTVDAYRALRTQLRRATPKNARVGLRFVDNAYSKFKTFERAGAYVKSQKDEAVFGPNQLQSSIKARYSPSQTTKGTAPLQDVADAGTATLGRVIDAPGGGTLSGISPFILTGSLAYAPVETASTLAALRGMTTEQMRRVLTGQESTETAKALARAIRAGVATY